MVLAFCRRDLAVAVCLCLLALSAGRASMEMHNRYLIAVSALFALVFVIMLYSLIRYRKADGATSRFSGPTGRVQWLWALVPMAILGAINIALIDHSDDRHAVAAKKIELAVAQTNGAVTHSQQSQQ